MAEGPPETPEEHEAWFETLASRRDQRIFTVTSRFEDKPVGVCGLYRIEPVHKHAELGFYMSPDGGRSTGVAVETELLLLDHALGAMGLCRLWCRVLSVSPQVIALHERFGFKVEGRLRAHFRTRGGLCDVVLLGILAEEFSAVQSGIARLVEQFAERSC